jgi:hypothetical protein
VAGLAVTGLADAAGLGPSGRDSRAVAGGERIVCGGCGQAKSVQAFYVVRGPFWYGDWRAQPCAQCCRRQVEQTAGWR